MRRLTLFLFMVLSVATAVRASDCTRQSVGFFPLPEMGAGLYKGVPGGLYPGGANSRPAAHDAIGLRLAAEVLPRDTSGAVDRQSGKIVFLTSGMSNTTMESQVFKQLADRDAQKNPQLVIVDGAQGGQAANVIVANGTLYWAEVDKRLAAAGVTPAQVQAVWMKQADISPNKPFPDHARVLQSELQTLAQTLRSRFPNLRLLYHSSRIYAGYATSALNPEPYAFEGGFSVKWLIEQQIQAEPASGDLSYDAGKVPWMAWGPYLWVDGLRMRSDGLTYACADLQPSDGTHPAPSAQNKVAALLLDFLKTDTTARPWFLKAATSPPVTPKPAALVNGASFQAPLTPRSIASLFGTELAGAAASASSLPLPANLGGASVEIDGVPCPLLYVSPTQINLVLPAGMLGSALVVRREGNASTTLPVAMLSYAPGIFTSNYLPAGPAAALHADYKAVSDTNPARRGETILLYLTGLGALDIVKWQAVTPPIVRIGGQDAAVTYAGPAPGFAGVDQINVVVPAGVSPGPARIDITVGSIAANPATLAVTSDK